MSDSYIDMGRGPSLSRDALQARVVFLLPLRVAEIRQSVGGRRPTLGEVAPLAVGSALYLALHADHLLAALQSAEAFECSRRIIDALVVMAHLSGGTDFMGLHIEADESPSGVSIRRISTPEEQL